MALVAAIDDSERATPVLAEAQKLAADLDEELYALHVLERSELVKVLEKDIEGQDITENYEVQEAAENAVAKALDDTAPVEPTIEVRVGDPASEIIDFSDSEDVRYVVIGGKQQSPTGKALFGSVTQQVMFDAPVPVLNVDIE